MKDHSSLPLVIFSDKAIDVMHTETRGNFSASGEETGGILVGRRLDGQRILIIAATQPGPNATHQPHMFSPDVEFANLELEKLRQNYPGTDYIGIWHKHPPTLDHPSGGDEAQVEEIFNDPDYSHINELIAPIVLFHNGKFSFKTYYVNRTLVKTRRFFQFVTHERVPNEVAKDLLDTPTSITPKWYINPEVQERLKIEKERLDRKFETSLKEEGDDVFITAKSKLNPQAIIYFVLHVGFPQTPPEVLMEHRGHQWTARSKPHSLSNWTPTDSTLLEVGKELMDQLDKAIMSSAKIPPVTRPPVQPAQPSTSLTSRILNLFSRNMRPLLMLGSSTLLLLLVTVSGIVIWRLSRQSGERPEATIVSATTDLSAAIAEAGPSPTQFFSANQPSTPTSTSTPSPQPTATPEPTPVATLTATSIPTSGLPTITPSPLPDKLRVQVTSSTGLNVRTGPGINYGNVPSSVTQYDNGWVRQGVIVEVISRNPEGSWWYIVYPDTPNGKGWISADPEYSEIIEGDPDQLPIVDTTTQNSIVTSTSSVPSPTFVPTTTSNVLFEAEPRIIFQDECIFLSWNIEDAQVIYLKDPESGGEEQLSSSSGEKWVCPVNKPITTYALRVVYPDGTQVTRNLEVVVNELPSVGNFSGNWDFNFGSMELTQSGNAVNGNYEWHGIDDGGGIIEGQVNGNKFQGTWIDNNDPNKRGNIEWILDDAKQTFMGEFIRTGINTPEKGQWCGARPGVPFPDNCGFSGFWKLFFGDNTVYGRGQLSQVGQSVSGTFKDDNGTDGTITHAEVNVDPFNGMMVWTVTGQWQMSDGRSGHFEWKYDQTKPQIFQGRHLVPNSEWCGWRENYGLDKPPDCLLR